MTSHNAEHDEWMQALVTGDLESGSPEAAELRACPACRAQLSNLQSLTSLLQSAGSEQRFILSEELHDAPAPGADRVSDVLRAGLQQRAGSPRRPFGAWLALAAVLIAGVWIGFQLGGGTQETNGGKPPVDRLLNSTQAWPAGDEITNLVRDGFQWAGDPAESYQLHLFDPSNPLKPWRKIACAGNTHSVSAEFEAEMRATSATWLWQYQRTSPQQPGSRSVPRSERYEFTFSQ